MKNRSVVRAIEILGLISDAKEGLSLNEIVEKTDIPKTTAYEIILMLMETQMVQSEEGKVRLYKIGLRSFLIGNRYIQNMDLIQMARPYVEEAMIKLNMTVFIAMLDGDQIVYLHKSEPENVPIYTANVSNREDLYCTSLGKAIMSGLSLEEQKELISTMKFRQRTSRTIMDGDSLLKDLVVTRERGYSLDDREILDFVMCIGTPLFDHKKKVVAAISAAGLYSDSRNTAEEGAILIEAARGISTMMGYEGDFYG